MFIAINNTSDMLQDIIQLTTILFLLSMVCERAAEFFKHHLCGSRFFHMGDTLTKSNKDIEEQARAYRILKINVWCGIVIATIIKADLIEMFNHLSTAGATVGWDSITDYDGNLYDWLITKKHWTIIPGIVFTGCFISFGSKFWHDLLDMLYQIKSAKRAIANSDTYKDENIAKLINDFKPDLALATFDKAKTELMLRSGINAVALKQDDKNSYYIEAKVSQLNGTLDAHFKSLYSNGMPETINIKYILSKSPIKAHGINLSAKIFDMQNTAKMGMLGCLVKPEKGNSNVRYILTCCHNVVHPVINFPYVIPGKNFIGTSPSNVNPVGTIHKAFRTYEMDVALVEIDPNKIKDFDNNVPKLGGVSQKSRTLEDKDKGETVYFYGSSSKQKDGIVTACKTVSTIEYSTDLFEMVDLIQVQKNGKSISEKGDSGSVVLDGDNSVIGLVVAGDELHTYIMPIEKILKKLEVCLI